MSWPPRERNGPNGATGVGLSQRERGFGGFDVYSEPESKHTPQVEEWIREATLALHAGDPEKAEQLLQKALAVEPESPDALNNLAAAYEMQGRRKKAHQMVHQIFERHPDYLFGRIGVAQLALRDGKIEEAEALLKPLVEQRRLHFSEFEALCRAMIELYQAQGDRNAARSWRLPFRRHIPRRRPSLRTVRSQQPARQHRRIQESVGEDAMGAAFGRWSLARRSGDFAG